jgi:membrane-bound lytic murein transglycosylase B
MSCVRRALAVLVVAAVTTAASGAEAQEAAPQTAPATDTPAIATISPELADVAVDTSGFRDLAAAYADAHGRRVQAAAALDELIPAERRLQLRVEEAAAARHRAAKRLAYIRAAIREVAVEDYTQSQVDDDASVPGDAAELNLAQQRQVLVDAVNEAHFEDEDAAEEERDAAVREHRLSRSMLDDIRTRITETRAERAAAAAEEADLEPRVQRARVQAPVLGVDFTLIALDAFFRAAQTLAAEDPACGVRWWALAGISRVEGRHGTFGGATISPSGDVTRPIIGIPLPAIGETDGGLLDGDPTVDHAVGPMQFIPSTWARWGRDGNDDGRADPQNFYDATASAAAYLCASGPGLDADAGLRRAYFSYNHSHSYVEQVLAHARGYQLALRETMP